MTNASIILPLLLFVGALGVSSQNSLHEQSQVQIKYELKESKLTLGEPVIMVFSAKNISASDVNIDLGIDKTQFFEFSVKTPSGQIFLGGPSLKEGLHTLGTITIASGDTYKQELLLNQWLEFKSPGRYVLEAKLNPKGSAEQGNTPSSQSGVLHLQIEPRDATRLTKVCAKLTAEVESSRSVEEALPPTLALSYVQDPIAVPYLAQLLSDHALTYHLAIAGLERIGDESAIEALLARLTDTYADISDRARGALERMEDRISNPNLRETVKRELASKPG